MDMDTPIAKRPKQIHWYTEWGGCEVVAAELPVGAMFDSIQRVTRNGRVEWSKARFMVVMSEDRGGVTSRFVRHLRYPDGRYKERALSDDEIEHYKDKVK